MMEQAMNSRFQISIVAIVAMTVGGIGAAQAQVVDGGFDHVSGGTPVDWQHFGAVEVIEAGVNHVLRLKEPAFGSLSRVHQTINIPTGTRYVSFRYRLETSANPNGSQHTPPDSFTAYLYAPATSQRLILADGAAPWLNALYSVQGFFYADADGTQEFQLPTTRSGPDSDGLHTVRLALPTDDAITGAVIEFGLASGRNHYDTAVLIDDVTLDCPPGYCCNPSDGTATRLDDGNPCTEDVCDEATGTVTHNDLTCCRGCFPTSGPTDIVFMVDHSRSMELEAFNHAGAAIETLLNIYGPYADRPRIGLGKFENPSNTTMLVNLTSDYDATGGLREELRNMKERTQELSGGTGLAKAIELAKEHLAAPGQSPNETGRRAAIIVLTDGFANNASQDDCEGPPPYTGDTRPGKQCWCFNRRLACEVEARKAEDLGINVFVQQYYSDDFAVCPDGNEDGAYGVEPWLRYKLATTPAHFFEDRRSAPQPPWEHDFVCTFVQMIEIINCDDLDPCTADRCVAGNCVHDPILDCP